MFFNLDAVHIFLVPFHAAEQHKNNRKKREDCLSHADGVASFAAPGYFEQRRVAPHVVYAGPSERLPFLVRFWASKNERKKNGYYQ